MGGNVSGSVYQALDGATTILEIQTAVNLLLPREMVKRAVSEAATKSIRSTQIPQELWNGNLLFLSRLDLGILIYLRKYGNFTNSKQFTRVVDVILGVSTSTNDNLKLIRFSAQFKFRL